VKGPLPVWAATTEGTVARITSNTRFIMAVPRA
jgi:hypothetical protein